MLETFKQRTGRSPDNDTNALREIGIALGVGATVLGFVPFLCGVVMMRVSARRRCISS
jgi:hypothetical protein